MKKSDIINALSRRHGLRRYLEICTPSTGLTFALVDAACFEPKHRLVYNCPEEVDDGLAYTYRTSLPFSHELIDTIDTASEGRAQYDLIFVDPWHSLKCSATDLAGAWRLLRPGGIMVVHDCNPADESLVSATPRLGEWCGLTYRAFIDFVLFRRDLRFCTVDTDYGCGVVHKIAPQSELSAADAEALELLQMNWIIAREDDERRYAFFDYDRARLLQLVSVEEFAIREGLDPAPATATGLAV